MRGADTVVRELIRSAVGTTFDRYFAETNTQQIEQWFNLGGSLKVEDDQPSDALLASLREIQGLVDKLAPLGITAKDAPERIVAAAEFLLEGMVAHRRLSRSEERGFSAGEKQRRQEQRSEKPSDDQQYEAWQSRRSRRGGGLN
jgi:magnesium chelatase subunit I